MENVSQEGMRDLENARTSTGLNPLGLAMIMEKWRMADTLATQYPNLVNVEDHENLTPFHRAVLENQFTLATLMLDECNANIYHTT
jgi:ankyrin repeat protein